MTAASYTNNDAAKNSLSFLYNDKEKRTKK